MTMDEWVNDMATIGPKGIVSKLKDRLHACLECPIRGACRVSPEIGSLECEETMIDVYVGPNDTVETKTDATSSTSEDTHDSVNHPMHYTSHPSGVECIQIAECYNFNVGQIIKYAWRQGLKHEEGMTDLDKQIEDLRKCAWYANREIQRLEKSKNTANI